MSERFKVQSWKGCVGAIPPWVRIPSPLDYFIFIICADIAQLVEQLIRNEQVTGSIPAIGSIFYSGSTAVGTEMNLKLVLDSLR